MSTPGEISQALRDGYRIAVHDSFFPFESMKAVVGTVHAVVDHGARAVFCSKEWAKTNQHPVVKP